MSASLNFHLVSIHTDTKPTSVPRTFYLFHNISGLFFFPKLSGLPSLTAIMGPFEMRIKTTTLTASCRQTSRELLLPRTRRRLHHRLLPWQPSLSSLLLGQSPIGVVKGGGRDCLKPAPTTRPACPFSVVESNIDFVLSIKLGGRG